MFLAHKDSAELLRPAQWDNQTPDTIKVFKSNRTDGGVWYIKVSQQEKAILKEFGVVTLDNGYTVYES